MDILPPTPDQNPFEEPNNEAGLSDPAAQGPLAHPAEIPHDPNTRGSRDHRTLLAEALAGYSGTPDVIGSLLLRYANWNRRMIDGDTGFGRRIRAKTEIALGELAATEAQRVVEASALRRTLADKRVQIVAEWHVRDVRPGIVTGHNAQVRDALQIVRRTERRVGRFY